MTRALSRALCFVTRLWIITLASICHGYLEDTVTPSADSLDGACHMQMARHSNRDKALVQKLVVDGDSQVTDTTDSVLCASFCARFNSELSDFNTRLSHIVRLPENEGPSYCEDFCDPGDASTCKCLRPWTERCQLRSCSKCSPCLSSTSSPLLTTEAPTHEPPASTTPHPTTTSEPTSAQSTSAPTTSTQTPEPPASTTPHPTTTLAPTSAPTTSTQTPEPPASTTPHPTTTSEPTSEPPASTTPHPTTTLAPTTSTQTPEPSSTTDTVTTVSNSDNNNDDNDDNTDSACRGKDILIAIDASKSVKEDGWMAEADFVVELVHGLLSADAGHRVSMLYFNKHANCITESGSCLQNVAAPFTHHAEPLVKALGKLSYSSIREGSTNHPQVYLTARDAFLNGRDNHDKVLVLVTDGETHKGQNCKTYSQSTMEAKIGKCQANHPCVGRGCLMEKCMCGQYTAALFKDYGYKLMVVGIANQNHVGASEAGIFDKQMRAIASDDGFFMAANFADLQGGAIANDLVQSACS